MTLYVSYYAKRTPLKQISISLYPPRGFKGPQILELAPTREILAVKDVNIYKPLYLARLEQLGFAAFREIIKYHSNNFTEDIVLCCYEGLQKPDQFCHRTMLMEYANTHWGTRITEL